MADGNKKGKKIRGSKSGGSQNRTPVESVDSLNSIARATILDLLGEGELAGFPSDNPLKDIFLDETPIMNADGTLNFQDVVVDWRMGTPDQTYMKGFPSIENEIGIGVELKASTPWTRTVTNNQLSAVRIRVSVPALSKTNMSNGDISGHSVSYAIDLKTGDGAFVEVLQNSFTGKTNNKYERPHRIDLPPSATGWTLRVRRLTADDDSSTIQDTTLIESFTEIIDAKLRYPNCAYIGTKVAAAQFRAIPQRAFRMLGRLMKIPSNYNPVTRAYTGTWNGTFNIGWTNNPAWIFYDLLTNKRFGLGDRVDENQIDIYSLYKIAQYCDELVPDGLGGMEPRFACTVYLQNQQEAYKVLQDLASVFRGLSYWSSGAVIPVGDMPRDPVYTYTNANVKDGKFSYQGSAKQARHTVALVSWSDPKDFNRQKVEYVEDQEGIQRYGHNAVQITAYGCLSQGQAQRMGRWILLTERLETDTVSFVVALEGQMLAMPGQVIRIADAKRAGRRMGGRLSSVAASSVIVDALPAVAPIAGDWLITHTPQGQAQKHQIQSVDLATRVVTINGAFATLPLPESVWSMESATLKTQLFNVLSVTEGEEGKTAVISALEHVPDKYSAIDNGTYIEPRPTIAIPSAVQRPPATLTITTNQRAGQVLASTVVTANWSAAEGAVSYEVSWRRDNGEWSSVQRVLGTQAELFNAFPGSYQCMVTARNVRGVVSVPKVSEIFVVADQSKTPGFVDQLNADIDAALITAENAQAAADGALEFFWQASPPTIGTGAGQAKEGDFWIDIDDGNHSWRVTGGVFVDAQDDQIGQALLAAQTAQGTADGKVTTWVGATAPTAPNVTSTKGIGDLWFNTTTKKLARWNGTDWNLNIADVTLDQLGGNGINLLPDQYSVYEATILPVFFGPSGMTASRDTGTKISSEAASLKLVVDGGSHHDVYFCAGPFTGNVRNIPNIGSKRYIVSVRMGCSIALDPTKVSFRMVDGVPNATPFVQPTQTADAAADGFLRYSVVIDAATLNSGYLALHLNLHDSYFNGATLWLTDLMVEEAIGNLNKPSTYVRGTAAGQAISALVAAQSAQATADSSIDIYRQATAPAGAKYGDYWQDSDDSKWWYCNGSSWVDATDTRLPQVVIDVGNAQSAANTAQTTANARIRLFTQNTQPTGGTYIVGDQWYNTDTKETRYYNGSGWSLLSDQTATTADMLLVNGDFENGFAGWDYREDASSWYIESSTNAATLAGQKGLVHANNATTPSARISNNIKFKCAAGTRIRVQGFVNWAGAQSGNCGIMIVFADASNNYLGEAGSWYSEGVGMGFQQWRRLVNTVTAPAGTVYAYVSILIQNSPTGYWCIDSIRAEVMVDNVDAVPDGSTYAKTKANVISNGVPVGIAYGRNLLANPTFDRNYEGQAQDNVRRTGGIIIDDWEVQANALGGPWVSHNGFGRSGRAMLMGAAGLINSSTYKFDRFNSRTKIPASPGKRYFIEAWGRQDYSTGVPAGVNVTNVIEVRCFDANGTSIGNAGGIVVGPREGDMGGVWGRRTAVGTTPAGTAYIQCHAYLLMTTGSASNIDVIGCMQQAWDDITIAAVTDMDNEIDHGAIYGKTANDDLYDYGGKRRIGLRVLGSRQQLAGPRNLPSNQVMGFGAVNNTVPLSANSAGQVTVNAFTVNLNGETVSYNAVTNAVVGLAVGTTYVIYTIDPYADGGTRTWYAATTVLAAQSAAMGVVVAGTVTIPSIGSSSGGSGGTGDPDDWCVDYDAVLPDGRLVRDLQPGDLVPCIDVTQFPFVIKMHPVQKIALGEAECSILHAANGVTLLQSDSTPMDLPEGGIAHTPEMLGKHVVTNLSGVMEKQEIVQVQPIGIRPVVKLNVGDRMFFAGSAPGATMGTHNARYKP